MDQWPDRDGVWALRKATDDRTVIQAMAHRYGVVSWIALAALIVTGGDPGHRQLVANADPQGRPRVDCRDAGRLAFGYGERSVVQGSRPSENEKNRARRPGFESLLTLVSVCLQTFTIFVLRHLLPTFLNQRTHAKTSQKRGDNPNGRAIAELGQTNPGIRREWLLNATLGIQAPTVAARDVRLEHKMPNMGRGLGSRTAPVRFL